MRLPARLVAGSSRRAGVALPVAALPSSAGHIRGGRALTFVPCRPMHAQILKKYAKNVAGATQEPAPGFLARVADWLNSKSIVVVPSGSCTRLQKTLTNASVACLST